MDHLICLENALLDLFLLESCIFDFGIWNYSCESFRKDPLKVNIWPKREENNLLLFPFHPKEY